MEKEKIKTILLVEDEPSLREMLEVAIKKWNYKIKSAENYSQGLQGLERGKIDCVLTDIKLPDGSGVDFLEKVKILPEKTPIILMTAFGTTDSAVQAMKHGAFYYLTKPFKLEELKGLLEKLFKEQQTSSSVIEKKEDSKKQFSIILFFQAGSRLLAVSPVI